MVENDINFNALISCKINNFVSVAMKIHFQYPFLYCQCNTCGIENRIICSSGNCAFKILQADDYLVEVIK